MKYFKVLLFFTSLFFSLSAFSEEAKNISLNFTDAKTQKILKIIADFSNKGIIIPSSELGLTSIYVKDLPWDKALQGIANSANLKLDITDSLIVVSKKTYNSKNID